MKVSSSLTFYYIPKFLKNDLIKRSEINIHHHAMECSFISFTIEKQVMVEPTGIESVTRSNW